MNIQRSLLQTLKTTSALLALSVSISACVNLPALGGASWKEEVLLHDGQKLIVERSQEYGGYGEPSSREPQLREEIWKFSIPRNKQRVIWKNDYGKKPGSSNLVLITLDFLGDTPYLAASPAGCISYNIWKRPNPPYVFFRFDGGAWRQIPLAEFPSEFAGANVAVGRPDPDHRAGTLSVATIKEENRNLEPHLRSIVRETIPNGGDSGCGEMVGNEKGSWLGMGLFRDQPSLDACLRYCTLYEFNSPYCPCVEIFRGK